MLKLPDGSCRGTARDLLRLLAQATGTDGGLLKPNPPVGQVEVSSHNLGTKVARTSSFGR